MSNSIEDLRTDLIKEAVIGLMMQDPTLYEKCKALAIIEINPHLSKDIRDLARDQIDKISCDLMDRVLDVPTGTNWSQHLSERAEPQYKFVNGAKVRMRQL